MAGVFWVALKEIALPDRRPELNWIRMLAVFVVRPGKADPGTKFPWMKKVRVFAGEESSIPLVAVNIPNGHPRR